MATLDCRTSPLSSPVMDENTTTPDDAPDGGIGSDLDPAVDAEVVRGDHALRLLQALANMKSATTTIPLVLVLSGQVIDGNIMSAREWLQETTNRITSGNMPEPVREALKDIYAPQMGALDDDDDLTPVLYVHMRDARVITSGGTPLNVGYLRLRLAEISGWTLGRFSD
ncbi:hypothetical protein [Terrabacter sp. NPDC000476]|uniref:hypothetical protein n=1 Tax=Terrabacter sp. NPDC000476 TaxID=3154258 RepID=UPI0033239FC9